MSDYGPQMGRNEREAEIGREIEQLSRAPFFVLRPDALVAVRDEFLRIRAGSGTDVEAGADDYTSAVVDNARRLNERLAEGCRGLDEARSKELELVTSGASGRGVPALSVVARSKPASTASVRGSPCEPSEHALVVFDG
jgi:hypothetical protein